MQLGCHSSENKLFYTQRANGPRARTWAGSNPRED